MTSATSPLPGQGPLVTLIIGETGRTSTTRGRSGRPGGNEAPKASQWSARWGPGGPGPIVPGPDGEADLSLAISPADARLVAEGQLAPSVAFMQGRLKTSGDNALLLQVLLWSETPAFQAALAGEAGRAAPGGTAGDHPPASKAQ